MGTVVSALGVYLSLMLDLPTGATIVCTFGIVLILMAIVRVHGPADGRGSGQTRPRQRDADSLRVGVTYNSSDAVPELRN